MKGINEIDFIENIIAGRHANRSRKIKGLRNLIAAGHTVKLAQYEYDVLLIDEVKAPWVVLEEWASRKI